MGSKNEIRVHTAMLRPSLLAGLRPMPRRPPPPDEPVDGDGPPPGRRRPGQRVRAAAAPPPCPPGEGAAPPASSIYVLELEAGLIYVGKSCDTRRRLMQHAGGHGSSVTRRFKPTGRRLPRMGTLEGEGDGPERDETLRQMHAHGIDRVRGWKFCTSRKRLNRSHRAEAESNIRELFDLCRRCGRQGHFARYCRKRVDRHGKRL